MPQENMQQEEENLDSLFDEFEEDTSVETTEAEEAEELPEDASSEGEEEETEESHKTADEEAAEEEQEEPETSEASPFDEQGRKDQEAFAALRTERNQYKQTIEKLASKAGVTVEKYLEDLAQQEMEAKAAEAKVPVEFYQKMAELEARDAQREQEAQALRFRTEIESFQRTYNLKPEELKGFVDICFENGIDLTQTNVSLDILYRGLNHDSIVEAERQKWIAQDSKNRESSTNPSGRGGSTPSASGSEVSSVEDLDRLVEGL